MKKLPQYILLAYLTLSFSTHIQAKEHHSHHSSHELGHKLYECCKRSRKDLHKVGHWVHEIRKNVNDLVGCETFITELPYTISKPGTYKLNCDLAFNPKTPGQTAITIASSNVVLDLDTYRLYQACGNSQPATGIFISPNTTNITITGERGTIQGFEGWGILCPGPNDTLGGNIKLENIIVEECGSDARSPGVVHVDGGILIGSSNDLSPIVDTPVSEVLISNVLVLNNKNFGIVTHATEGITIQDSIIDGTYSEAPSFYVIGLVINGPLQADPMPRIKNVEISRTTITNTHCETIASYDPSVPSIGVLGCIMQGTDNLTVVDSTFSQTRAGALNNNAAQEAGPFVTYSVNCIQGGIMNCVYDNCTFADAVGDKWTFIAQNFHTSANTSFPSGLQITTGHVYKNCSASGATGYYIANNFGFYYVEGLVVDNCTAMNSTLLANGEQSIYDAGSSFLSMGCYGFLCFGGVGNTGGDHQKQNDRGQTQQVIFKDCIAQEMNAEVGQVAGFFYGGGPFFGFQSAPTYSVGTASQTGTTVTGSGTSWTSVVPSLVGGVITFPTPGVPTGLQAIITSVDSDTQLTVSFPLNVADQPYFIQYVPTEEIHLKDVAFINCVAQEITTNGDMPATSFAPFLSAGPGVANGILVDRGVTQAGGAGGAAEAPGFHFDYKPAESLENAYVQNCRISNVQGAGAGLALSGGIVMLGVDKATATDSHVTGGNQDGYFFTGGFSWINPFIAIAATTNSIVEESTADNNAGDGFHDTAGTNAFVQNTAFRNGTNYDIGASASVGNVDIP